MAVEFGPTTVVTEPFNEAFGRADGLITTLRQLVDEGGSLPHVPGTPLWLHYSGSAYGWATTTSGDSRGWVSRTSVEVLIPGRGQRFSLLGRSVATVSDATSPYSVEASRGNELGSDFKLIYDFGKARVTPSISTLGHWQTVVPKVAGEPNDELVGSSLVAMGDKRYYPAGGYPDDTNFSRISPLEVDRFTTIVGRVLDAVEAAELIFQGEKPVEVLDAMGYIFPKDFLERIPA